MLIRPCDTKVRYLTEDAARRGASWANRCERLDRERSREQRRARRKPGRFVTRAYQCEHCAGWHLTTHGRLKDMRVLRRHHSDPGVPHGRRVELLKFARWLGATYPVRGPHVLFVRVVDADSLSFPASEGPAEAEGYAFGCFSRPKRSPTELHESVNLQIVVAASFDIPEEEVDAHPSVRYATLLEILAHEWSHYLEWVDALDADEDRCERFAADAVREWQRLHHGECVAALGSDAA